MTTYVRIYSFRIFACILLILSVSRNYAIGDIPTFSGDSRGSNIQWHDFFKSQEGVFQPKTGYRISFDYKVIARSPDAKFYLVVNDTSQHRKNFDWQDWAGKLGDTGRISTMFIDRDKDQYVLIIGIENHAAIEISHLNIVPDPLLKPLDLTFPTPNRTWQSKGNTTYYIDSMTGTDYNPGTSQLKPWRSLSRVNQGIFSAGDKILLHVGSSWNGYLAPAGSGTAVSPITITSYGSGPKPQINSQGLWLAAVYLSNSSFIKVQNLEISNHGREPQPKLTGVTVSESECGTARNIVLDGLYIHDITGSDVKTEGGGAGIDCVCIGNKVRTRFDGLLIQNCRLVRTDRNGITIDGEYARIFWYPCLHVVIRRNLLEDIGGDGIVPIGCDGALIERNVLHGGRMRTRDYAAGIWPWSCDNTIVQYNEVSGMKGTNDGEGFDSDWNCNHSLFQYNYSHDNDGGFMLICDDGTQYPPYYVGNNGTVVRYNVSVDDGQYTFSICGRTANTEIYNNTIYIGAGSANRIVNGGTWGGWPQGTYFANNVFYSVQPVDFEFGGMITVVFTHNAYFGKIDGRPYDCVPILNNPQLLRPGSKIPKDYHPLSNSPLINSGVVIVNNGGRDYDGEVISQRTAPTIGAFQNSR